MCGPSTSVRTYISVWSLRCIAILGALLLPLSGCSQSTTTSSSQTVDGLYKVDIGEVVAGQSSTFMCSIPKAFVNGRYSAGTKLFAACSCLQIDKATMDRNDGSLDISGKYLAGTAVGTVETVLLVSGKKQAEPLAQFAAHHVAPFTLEDDNLSLNGDSKTTRRRIDLYQKANTAVVKPIITETSPNIDANIVNDGGSLYLAVRPKQVATTSGKKLPVGFIALSSPNKQFVKMVLVHLGNGYSRLRQQISMFRHGNKLTGDEITLVISGPKKSKRNPIYVASPSNIQLLPVRVTDNGCIVKIKIAKPWKERSKRFIIQQSNGQNLNEFSVLDVVDI